MKKFVAVLGRQPRISVAELEALYENVQLIRADLAEFWAEKLPDINRLGGTLKLAESIKQPLSMFLKSLTVNGKITLGLSDYSKRATGYSAQGEALKIKRILTKFGHSVRVVPNRTATLSSATSYHNHLYTDSKIELIKFGKNYYRVRAVQNIDAYVKRDQVRPARDAKVGMLPPKLAQILINLNGRLQPKARVLDPFCGTGVLLQEAKLMGFSVYGTDINARMIDYSTKNLEWLDKNFLRAGSENETAARDGRAIIKNSMQDALAVGDATKYQWTPPIDAVACETYLGPPMSLPPAEIKLKEAKQTCGNIILGFLKNLAPQLKTGTPVTIAVPAWLRPDGTYERLNLLDEIQSLSYNVVSFKNLAQSDLLYHREKQVVAREIIVLRKK